jgi:hypothetical protein
MLRIGFAEGCAKPGFSDNIADAAPAALSNCLLVILLFPFHKLEGE